MSSSIFSDSNPLLDELIAAYLEAIDQGERPDREELIAEHPDQAAGLRAFFADLSHFDKSPPPRHQPAEDDETAVQPLAHANVSSDEEVLDFGEYELLEEIGRGGMGVVYKACQTSLNRIVALKVVLRGKLATPIDIARFRAEAEAAAQLDHRNIAPVYEVGEHNRLQYFTMKYIKGRELSRVPLELPRDEVARIKAVAEAIHYAHQHGILHRDLKPGNILIDFDNVPYIVDFGLAKRLDDSVQSLTNTGDVLGTPRYMAPEQATGSKSLTTATDVYALGAILYERLTGAPLITGKNFLEVLDGVRAGADQSRLLALSRTIGRDLSTILQKCLEPEPSRRYSSCNLLAEELGRWLNGIPILARPSGCWERTTKWVNRNRALSSIIAIATASLAVAIAFWFKAEWNRIDIVTTELVKRLLIADAKSVSSIMHEIDQAPHSIRTKLKAELVNSSENSQWRLQAALLPSDQQLRFPLLSELLKSDPVTANAIASRLEGIADAEVPSLWSEIETARSDDPFRTLLAAIALRVLDPESHHWCDQVTCQTIAAAALKVPRETLSTWVDSLRFQSASAVHLGAFWLEVLCDRKSPEEHQAAAAYLLISIARQAPEIAVQSLCSSPNHLFDRLYKGIGEIPRFHGIVEAEYSLDITGLVDQNVQEVAKRQAKAAIALARSGKIQPWLELLHSSTNNSQRTFLITHSAQLGVPSAPVVHAFLSSKNATTTLQNNSRRQAEELGKLRALLMILGHFDQTIATQEVCISVGQVFQECSDPGVHAASEWLLKQWHLNVPSIQRGQISDRSRQWYVNSNGHTMMAIQNDLPVQFGSPATEANRNEHEHLHFRKLLYPFWISSTETQLRQYRLFLEESPKYAYPYETFYAPTDDCPQIVMSYFTAAAYCNWLSRRENLPEVYIVNANGVIDNDASISSDHFDAGGYRLPTETEWECACRAGTNTAFSFGDDPEALIHFAWYLNNAENHAWPVGQKLPNDFGLFDMSGNVWEWCSEEHRNYTTGAKEPTDDIRPYGKLFENSFRVQRGGSFASQPRYTRSAFRDLKHAADRSGQWGFRIARTIVSTSKE